jgi:hypothetical protein
VRDFSPWAGKKVGLRRWVGHASNEWRHCLKSQFLNDCSVDLHFEDMKKRGVDDLASAAMLQGGNVVIDSCGVRPLFIVYELSSRHSLEY